MNRYTLTLDQTIHPTSSSKYQDQSTSVYPHYLAMKNPSEIIQLYTKMLLNAANTKLNLFILTHTTKASNEITHSANETSFGSTHPSVKT